MMERMDNIICKSSAEMKRIGSGTAIRPVKRLYPLEVCCAA